MARNRRHKPPIDELISDIESWQNSQPQELVQFARYWHGRTGKDAQVSREFWEWVFRKLGSR